MHADLYFNKKLHHWLLLRLSKVQNNEEMCGVERRFLALSVWKMNNDHISQTVLI